VKKTKTEGISHKKMESILSQRTAVFSYCDVEFYHCEKSLHGGGMALPWLRLFVFGVFTAEKIKQKASPGGEKSAGAAILCGARSYSRQSNEISTKDEVCVCQPNQSIPLPRPALT
jgi:hypothetical protein